MAKIFLVIALFVPFVSNSQVENGLDFHLDSAAIRDSWNLISFQLPPGKLNQLHTAKGEKLNLTVSHIIINDESAEAKHIRVRGNTSSYFRRKSFNIDLKKKGPLSLPFRHFCP